MGGIDRIWPVQRSHKPLPGPGMCLEGIQLDCHEGGTGAGERASALGLIGLPGSQEELCVSLGNFSLAPAEPF